MSENLVNTLDGNTFVVSDRRGDIEASPTDSAGLFSFDTRFLSKWVLTIDGQRLNPLSVDDLHYFETRFFLVPGTGTIYVNATLSVIRQRAVGNGFHEELTILNHDEKPVDLSVRIDAGSDFADIFEIKDAVGKKGKYYHRIDKQQLLLGYERETFRRETTISSTAPAQLDEDGLSFSLKIGPHSSWTTELAVVTALVGRGGEARQAQVRAGSTDGAAEHGGAAWRSGWTMRRRWCPTGSHFTRRTAAASSISPHYASALPIGHGASLPAAGLPWFMAIFGRDSILTSLQALPFAPELAATTIRALGAWQGTRVDDFRDEDPGRIVHEIRAGETAAFEEQPHSPYYGNADATPLYVVLLDEYERWSGDSELVREPRTAGARRAGMDRRVRGPPGQRIHLLPAA